MIGTNIVWNVWPGIKSQRVLCEKVIDIRSLGKRKRRWFIWLDLDECSVVRLVIWAWVTYSAYSRFLSIFDYVELQHEKKLLVEQFDKWVCNVLLMTADMGMFVASDPCKTHGFLRGQVCTVSHLFVGVFRVWQPGYFCLFIIIRLTTRGISNHSNDAAFTMLL